MSLETPHIIRAMRLSGNRPGIIAQWKADVEAWAQMNRTDADAAAVNAWLPLWQPRPFYTVEELAPLWPALAVATGFTKHWPNVLKSPARLRHELDYYGLPRLGGYPEYFICERLHYWQCAKPSIIAREIENAHA